MAEYAGMLMAGMLLWVAFLFVREVLADRAVTAFRERATTMAGAGMVRIDTLQTPVLSWKTQFRSSTFVWGPDEYTLHADRQLIARFWLTPFQGHGELIEMETSEGRWRCTAVGTEKIRVARPETAHNSGSGIFVLVQDGKNRISWIGFSGGHGFTLQFDEQKRDPARFELVDPDGVVVMRAHVGAEGSGSLEIQEPAWASAMRRDVMLMGCYAVIRSRYYFCPEETDNYTD